MSNDSTGPRYPSVHDIQEALGMCPRKFMDTFAQERGIFLFRATKDDLAQHLTSYFYEQKELDEIRKRAFRAHLSKSTSGFILSSNEEEFSPVNILDGLRPELDEKSGVKLGAIVETSDGVFTGEMSYTVNKPGRIELLQSEPRTVDYTFRKLEDNSFQVYVEADSSGDAQKFANFIRTAMEKEARLETIQYDLMTSAQTIQFFDDLCAGGIDESWRMTQVNRLTFRRGKATLNGESDTEEEAADAKAEILSGINRAILDGKDLRENAFVKQSETDGYRFSAMSIEFEHVSDPYVVEVRVEFKLRPEIFEIEIAKYQKRVMKETLETLELEHMSVNEEMDMRSAIWQRAKSIYDALVAAA